MKTMMASMVIFVTAFSSIAKAQQTIIPPAEGIAIVSGGNYPSGTVYANGKAYPPGTKIEGGQKFEELGNGMMAMPNPGMVYSSPGVMTSGSMYSPSYSNGNVYGAGYNGYGSTGIINAGFSTGYYGNNGYYGGYNRGFGYNNTGYYGAPNRSYFGSSWYNGNYGSRGRGGRYR